MEHLRQSVPATPNRSPDSPSGRPRQPSRHPQLPCNRAKRPRIPAQQRTRPVRSIATSCCSTARRLTWQLIWPHLQPPRPPRPFRLGCATLAAALAVRMQHDVSQCMISVKSVSMMIGPSNATRLPGRWLFAEPASHAGLWLTGSRAAAHYLWACAAAKIQAFLQEIFGSPALSVKPERYCVQERLQVLGLAKTHASSRKRPKVP